MQRAPYPDYQYLSIGIVIVVVVDCERFLCSLGVLCFYLLQYQFPAKSFPPAKISIDSKVPRDGQTHGVGYNIE